MFDGPCRLAALGKDGFLSRLGLSEKTYQYITVLHLFINEMCRENVRF